MSVFHQAKRAYRENGFFYLLREGFNFTVKKSVWAIFPEVPLKKLIVRSRFLTTMFYYVRGSFYNEQRSVLWGQVRFRDQEQGDSGPYYRMVRGTHRVEKGLSMKEMKPVFGERYILDLVTATETVCAERTLSEIESDDRIQWALDVQERYFEVVEETPITGKAADTYERILAETGYETGEKTPIVRKELPDPPVGPEELKRLAERRYSTRWFQDRSVPREALDEAVAVAAESPSACNRQSFEFRFFDDDERKTEILELPPGVTGYKENIPCLAAIVGKQRAYHHDRDRHVIYIDASLAAMAFQFSLETQGLASCCLNWPAVRKRENAMSEVLGLEGDETVIMLMAIGYPDPNGKIPYSEKKSVEELRSFNE